MRSDRKSHPCVYKSHAALLLPMQYCDAIRSQSHVAIRKGPRSKNPIRRLPSRLIKRLARSSLRHSISSAKIQWPTLIPLSLLPISLAKPSPPSIPLIQQLTLPLPPTRPPVVQSTSLNCFVLPKDKGDQSTSTKCISSSTAAFNRQYGQEGKGPSTNRQMHLTVMGLHPIRHSSHLRGQQST